VVVDCGALEEGGEGFSGSGHCVRLFRYAGGGFCSCHSAMFKTPLSCSRRNAMQSLGVRR